MKNIKSQGNGEQPAISRRHFIQASSALIALPFVSSASYRSGARCDGN
ncbi:putative anaerobic dimethylsulfoxide reductase [Salmonella enterica subsp. enterica]|uniref:Putative anaerobic dimethylsulfoxide reductase n=1 Tax=Salmonella enterica I TaxID=59201 RepID=A0A447N6A1_SALET|nr:putative anaerobic dimethylsulfoxide reductase [Salmonella enterica subsp. enterica]